MNTKIKIPKGNTTNYLIVLVIGLLLGWLFFHHSEEKKDGIESHSEHVEDETIWTCSMHPQIKMHEPGLCPICNMELIPLETGVPGEEDLNPNEIIMTESAMKLAEIQTMHVRRDYSMKEVFLLGKVKPDERKITELTARFGGRLEKLYVNFTGQHVKKGEKLATIYSPELVTAQKELLEAIDYKESNPAFYRATRNKLKLWDLTDTQIDAIEKGGEPKTYFDVLSPISGTVTQRHVAVGDYLKEGNALFQLIDLTHLWVMFEAYESDLSWLQTGDRVEFTVQSIPGKTYKGKITYIDPFLDPNTRVAYVRVEINNYTRELKPEMFVNGVIHPNISGNKKDLLIPKTAVLWTGKRSVVYVKVPGREQTSFIYREIVLGPEAGDLYVVKEGLLEEEEIAINGVFKIDAAAQLEGKQSMMNPEGNSMKMEHNHTMDMDMNKNGHTKKDQSDEMTEDMEKSMNNKSVHKETQPEIKQVANVEQVTFKVSGNCEMCKAAIETAVGGMNGVNTADWNIETKQLKVSFNKDKTSLNKIHKIIAETGYDTEKEKATDEAFNKLPPCCKYTRE